LGRIGRSTLKAVQGIDGVDVVAVNDLIPPGNLAYLLRYDTVYGRYGKPVTATPWSSMRTGSRLFARRDSAELPWADLRVDLVFECTGAFRREEDLKEHLSAGARFVILSAPAKTETAPLWCTASTKARRRANPGEFTFAAG
jgi:glyceraldehyde 3-phosphate dehydrogenase